MLARLERARDDASLSETEAREMLEEDGIDVDAEFKLLLEGIATRHETERRKHLTDAEHAYRLLDSSTRPAPTRNRIENMARIGAHQRRHPELTANFHDLTHMSDHDLQTLVEELDELAGDGEEK